MNAICVAGLCALCFVSAVQASVRLDWSLVPRTNDMGAGLTDLQGPIVLQGAQRTLRIELRYTLVDLASGPQISGLDAVQLDIRGSSVASPLSSGSAGTIQKSRLTSGQAFGFGTVGSGASLAAAAPLNPDTTGYQNGFGPSTSDYTGMMSPFRYFPDQSDNSYLSNGVVSGLNMVSFLPLSLDNPHQKSSPLNGNNVTWGVFAMEFTAGNLFDGTVTFRTLTNADPDTHNAFVYFTGNNTSGTESTLYTESSITITVHPVPGPATLAVMAPAVILGARRRRSDCVR